MGARAGAGVPRRVVVSGLGVVSAAGLGIGPTWDRLRRAPPTPEIYEAPPPAAGVRFLGYRVPPYDLADLGLAPRCLRWLDAPPLRCARDLRHMVAATALALADAGLPREWEDADPPIALVAANESPGFNDLSQALFTHGAAGLPPADAEEQYARLAAPFFELNTFLPPYYVARAFGVGGPSLFVNSACASGLSAIDVAAHAVRSGRSRLAIATAADDPFNAAKFYWFRDRGLYAADGAIRPFDARQRGTVFGEGGAALILEDRESAEARGAHVYAEYAGAGFAQDGWKITVPAPTRMRAERALRAALEEAEVVPSDVDLVVPHGTGTPASDLYEARVLHGVFGGVTPYPSVTALKPLIGHALGASALMESVLVLAAMDRACIPPTLGHEIPCTRDVVPLVTAWREQPIRTAVKLTCAFGGYHGAVVFRKPA